MNDDMKILKTMLLTWNDDQVKQAWSLIQNEGVARQAKRSAVNRRALSPGDKVHFMNAGVRVDGTVVRVKRKKAIVEVTADRRNWDVPLSMLVREA